MKRHKYISAQDLQDKNIPPPKWLVEGLLPQGVTLLCAPSKMGKSWLMLQLSLAIASGQPFLGFPTNKQKVMYYTFEDDESRLKDRINKMINGEKAPENALFSTSITSLDSDLIFNMREDVMDEPEIGLFIIDTLQKVRGRLQSGETAYACDYREMGIFKQFCNTWNVSILLVHHTRKQKDDDTFNQISGTTGLMGAADTTFLLSKMSRSDETATLKITGRDIAETEYILSFDKDGCMWKMEGTAQEKERKEFEKSYNSSPIVSTIKELTSDSPYKWQGTASELLTHVGQRCGNIGELSERKVAREIERFEELLKSKDGITHEFYCRADGRIHTFIREPLNDFSE